MTRTTVFTWTTGTPVQNFFDNLCTRKTDAVGTMRTNRRVSRFHEKGQTKKGGKCGSIPQETDDHEVERQKGCRIRQHIS